MIKVVLRPSSEIETGAKLGRARPFFMILYVMGREARISLPVVAARVLPGTVNFTE